ncbi:MAG: hypothetical protein WCI73_14010, partial [Phycisphaerae bacterium]
MAVLVVMSRPNFSFSYDPATGLLAFQSPQGLLHLACQAHAAQPHDPDAGLAWSLLEQTENAEGVLWRFAAQQTVWTKKTLCVHIRQNDVLFWLELEGDAPIDTLTFFAGIPADKLNEPQSTLSHLSWARRNFARDWSGSPFSCAAVFNPQPDAFGEQQLPATVSQRITCATTFGPQVFNTFFAPPLYAYVLDDHFCLGLAAPIGQSRFTHFDYVATHGWGLQLHYDAMTRVAGSFKSPILRLAPCSQVEGGLADYVNYLRSSGLAPAPASAPDWAYRPMFCGWGQQTVWNNQAQAGAVTDPGTPIIPGTGSYGNQAAYERMLDLLTQFQIPFGNLTIDMGWSPVTALPIPDSEGWTDLRGFIERLHKQGKKVLLWLGCWHTRGLDDKFKMVHDPGLADWCDPTNPEFMQRLGDHIQHAISPRGGGLNADGFKLDFTGDVPRGSGYRPCANLWGLDLVHHYVKFIHDAMKSAKADTVLETHCANPQFADLTEMLRLNDIFSNRTDINTRMAFRSCMARIANPCCPIDTDNDPFISH